MSRGDNWEKNYICESTGLAQKMDFVVFSFSGKKVCAVVFSSR